MAGGFWKELQRGAKVSGCGNCCRLLGLTEIVSKSKKLMSDAFSEVTSIYYCGQEGSGGRVEGVGREGGGKDGSGSGRDTNDA